MLSVKNISKHYGPRAALDDVSFTLAGGQFCALLGPNGAGKSTLFQLLTGLFVPSAGTIHVNDLPLASQAPQALAHIGVVFQQQSLDLDLTVQQNLLFHADLHGMARAVAMERIALDAESLGLTSDMKRPVRELSGGSRRKVELARALLHRPALLLMDEATVGLDPQSRRDLLATVRRDVATRQTNVLWATHWVEECAEADRVLILHEGKIVADGTVPAVTAALGQGTLEQGFIAATSSKKAAKP